MIATATLGLFDDLLAHLERIAPEDSINLTPGPYNEALEADANLAFLTKDAIPLDPSRAAVVALIDDAVPFAHQHFRIGSASRVASVWFQDARPDKESGIGSDLPFGRELRGAQISALAASLDAGRLADEDALYRAAGVLDMRRPSPQRLAFASGHGAAVAGLAGGFPTAQAEVARNLPILAVCLPPYVVRDTLGMAAPFYVMLAILQIVHRARRLGRFLERCHGLTLGTVRLPVVINLSFGPMAGPKDGLSNLERLMDAVSAARTPDLGPVRFVIAAGNHRLARGRARVAVHADQPLLWQVRPDDTTPSFLELWGPARPGVEAPAIPVQIECSPPGAMRPILTSFVAHGTFQTLQMNGREVARAYLQRRVIEGRSREVVTLVVPPTRPERLGQPYGLPGCWRVRVLSTEGGDYDAFVQRDDSMPDFGPRGARQSRLVDPAYERLDAAGRPLLRDPVARTHGVLRAATVNAFATGREPLRVGGCIGRTSVVAPYSGLGPWTDAPDADGDVLAPAAGSASRPFLQVIGNQSGARRHMSGTSMAAALVSRELALASVGGIREEAGRADLAEILRLRLASPDRDLPSERWFSLKQAFEPDEGRRNAPDHA